MISLSNMEDFKKEWIKCKKEAIESGDFLFYKSFLEKTYKDFFKLYAEVRSPDVVLLVDKVLGIVTCELKVISIKCEDKNY